MRGSGRFAKPVPVWQVSAGVCGQARAARHRETRVLLDIRIVVHLLLAVLVVDEGGGSLGVAATATRARRQDVVADVPAELVGNVDATVRRGSDPVVEVRPIEAGFSRFLLLGGVDVDIGAHGGDLKLLHGRDGSVARPRCVRRRLVNRLKVTSLERLEHWVVLCADLLLDYLA